MSLTQKEKDARKKGIGGTDASVIMGVNNYKSAYTLFQEKTGMISDEIPDNEAMYWGNSFENNVLNRFYEDMPHLRPTFREEKDTVVIRPGGIPDYVIGMTDSVFAEMDEEIILGFGIVDAKTMCWPAYDSIEEVVQSIEIGNHHYYYQIQHYLLLTGCTVGYIAILFMDKREFRIIKIQRNEEDINLMLTAYEHFWNCVESNSWDRVIDGSESTTKTIKSMNHIENNLEKQLSEGSVQLWDTIIQRKEMIKELDESKRTMENQIRNELGEYTYGVLPGGRKLSLKVTNKKGYQPKYIEPTSYRSLREVKQKRK